MANKQYTLILNFGYAESGRLGFMPWTSKKKFKDAKEAILDLARYLKDRYLENTSRPLKKCCQKSTENEGAEYCLKCGHPLIESVFVGERFSDWLIGLDTDANTFHEYIAWDSDPEWEAGTFGPNQRFVYQAEAVLAAAVGSPKDPDITFEEICRRRTKSKSDDFTYY